MAALPEDDTTYPSEIYQLEQQDPVRAGALPDGISNLQAKQLADRTAWLKARSERAPSTEQTGMMEFADEEEHVAGTRQDVAANPAGVKAAIDNRVSITSHKFVLISDCLAMEEI